MHQKEIEMVNELKDEYDAALDYFHDSCIANVPENAVFKAAWANVKATRDAFETDAYGYVNGDDDLKNDARESRASARKSLFYNSRDEFFEDQHINDVYDAAIEHDEIEAADKIYAIESAEIECIIDNDIENEQIEALENFDIARSELHFT